MIEEEVVAETIGEMMGDVEGVKLDFGTEVLLVFLLLFLYVTSANVIESTKVFFFFNCVF